VPVATLYGFDEQSRQAGFLEALDETDVFGAPRPISWNTLKLQRALLAYKTQKKVSFRVCCFVDAFDECDADDETMAEIGEFLKSLADRPDGKGGDGVRIKVFIASRPEVNLGDLFGQFEGLSKQDHTRDDILQYVTNRLRNNRGFQETIKDETRVSATNNLISGIVNESSGVFLWVRLVLDGFCRRLTAGQSVEDLISRLNVIPKDLHKFSGPILGKVDPSFSAESFILLESVPRARKPFTPLQLALIVRSEVGDEPLMSLDLARLKASASAIGRSIAD